MTINGTSGLVFNDASTQNTAATGFGFKNRIINGAMMIDQRNAGASVNPTDGQYTLDRWVNEVSQTAKISVQQNAGSVTPPAGFTNYLGVTSLATTSLGAGDYFTIEQRIEGFNTADFGWGTANASTVTLSFWVRSSLTGTFGGSLTNSGNSRSYPFTYTISAANTWEQKSITIIGDTSGTWLKTTGNGIQVNFSLGMGSTRTSTAGSWQSGNFLSVTGATSVVGTNGATFYITGVQLEKGSTATSFDYRPYGTELALCQRYLPAWVLPSSAAIATTWVYSTGTSGPFILTNPVPVRTPATGLVISSASNFSVSDGDSGTACNSITFSNGTLNTSAFVWNTASGRTNFRPHVFYSNTTNAYILGTGCEL
jgi:hypothetical protein